jgi:hypothetical protein
MDAPLRIEERLNAGRLRLVLGQANPRIAPTSAEKEVRA